MGFFHLPYKEFLLPNTELLQLDQDKRGDKFSINLSSFFGQKLNYFAGKRSLNLLASIKYLR